MFVQTCTDKMKENKPTQGGHHLHHLFYRIFGMTLCAFAIHIRFSGSTVIRLHTYKNTLSLCLKPFGKTYQEHSCRGSRNGIWWDQSKPSR